MIIINISVVIQIIFMGLLRGGIYALMAVGLSLVFGILKIVNFAQGELFMIGAYLMYVLVFLFNLDPTIALIITALMMFLIGGIIEKFIIFPLREKTGRLWLSNSFVLTIGLSMILQNIALIVAGPMYRGVTYLWSGTLEFVGVRFSIERLNILFISFIVILVLWYIIKYTYVGKAIRGTSQDGQAAKTLGINVNFLYTLTFALSAALSGIAGGLLLSINGVFPTVGVTPNCKGFAVVILGGLGSIKGAIISGLTLGLIEAFAIYFISAGWQNVISLALIIAVLLIKPEGVFKE